MTGALLNAAGIVLGGLFGLARRTPLSPQTQSFFKLALGVATVFYGLRLTWYSIGGSFGHVVKQIVIAFLSIMLGKLVGHWLGFQNASNRLGQYARKLIEQARPGDPQRFSSGFTACTILFCVSPLGILGAVQDGLPPTGGGGYFYLLAIKGVMDGLATMGFIYIFGSSAILAALPVFVLQGVMTLACANYLEPFLRMHGDGLVASVNAVGGLVVCTVSLVIFEIRKVELADYLPCLAIAPLITWIWP